MKKVWIFLLIAVVLIAWTLTRERFEPTPSIQAPPYDKEDKIRIFGLLSTPDKAFLMTNMKAQDPTNGAVFDALSVKTGLSAAEKAKLQEAKNALEEKAGGLLTPSIEKFYTDVFKPATVPITPQKIDTFLTTDTNTLVTKEMLKRALTTYFISQGGVSSNSAYNTILTGLGQGQGYLNTAGGAAGGSSNTTGNTTGGSSNTTGNTTGGSSNTIGGTTGGTTGGSSNTTGGSSNTTGGSGVTGRLNRLFGPLFTGFGTSSPKGLVDTTKSNMYPELLGGNPNLNYKSGQSFAPGDMEIIPDPYRVSQQFAASSYSFKTEPVPFLTDFSAFQR